MVIRLGDFLRVYDEKTAVSHKAQKVLLSLFFAPQKFAIKY